MILLLTPWFGMWFNIFKQILLQILSALQEFFLSKSCEKTTDSMGFRVYASIYPDRHLCRTTIMSTVPSNRNIEDVLAEQLLRVEKSISVMCKIHFKANPNQIQIHLDGSNLNPNQILQGQSFP